MIDEQGGPCSREGFGMVEFAGVGHVGLTVTDLTRSERFYSDVFGLIRSMDFGYGRVLVHWQTGFVIGLSRHEGATALPFTELNTGLDHLAFTAAGRDELVEWERKLDPSAWSTHRSGTWSSAHT